MCCDNPPVFMDSSVSELDWLEISFKILEADEPSDEWVWRWDSIIYFGISRWLRSNYCMCMVLLITLFTVLIFCMRWWITSILFVNLTNPYILEKVVIISPMVIGSLICPSPNNQGCLKHWVAVILQSGRLVAVLVMKLQTFLKIYL